MQHWTAHCRPQHHWTQSVVNQWLEKKGPTYLSITADTNCADPTLHSHPLMLLCELQGCGQTGESSTSIHHINKLWISTELWLNTNCCCDGSCEIRGHCSLSPWFVCPKNSLLHSGPKLKSRLFLMQHRVPSIRNKNLEFTGFTETTSKTDFCRRSLTISVWTEKRSAGVGAFWFKAHAVIFTIPRGKNRNGSTIPSIGIRPCRKIQVWTRLRNERDADAWQSQSWELNNPAAEQEAGEMILLILSENKPSASDTLMSDRKRNEWIDSGISPPHRSSMAHD